MEKSNKQKCLEMWEWLADNPTKSKREYYFYLDANKRADEWDDCWACKEEQIRDKYTEALTCFENCPITWGKDGAKIHCFVLDSPYTKWLRAENSKEREKYARQIVDLIKTTWEE